MIALCSLLLELLPFLELFGIGERNAVHTLKAVVGGLAEPVRARVLRL